MTSYTTISMASIKADHDDLTFNYDRSLQNDLIIILQKLLM